MDDFRRRVAGMDMRFKHGRLGSQLFSAALIGSVLGVGARMVALENFANVPVGMWTSAAIGAVVAVVLSLLITRN